MLTALAILAAALTIRAILGPYVLFVDHLAGRNGFNSPFHVKVERGPFQAAIFAQELWESDRALLRLIPGLSRKMELHSHEVEVQAAGLIYGAEVAAYRYNEARRMGSYRQLKGLSPEAIEAGMLSYAEKARKWVEGHRRALEKAKTR